MLGLLAIVAGALRDLLPELAAAFARLLGRFLALTRALGRAGAVFRSTLLGLAAVLGFAAILAVLATARRRQFDSPSDLLRTRGVLGQEHHGDIERVSGRRLR